MQKHNQQKDDPKKDFLKSKKYRNKSNIPQLTSKNSKKEFLREIHGLLLSPDIRVPTKSAATSPTNNIPSKMVYKLINILL